MKAGLPLAVLAALLSGCLGGESGGNPNLLAPKLVLAARPDGDLTFYVHSAFGERPYDWLEVRIDNRSVSLRNESYSLEESTNATGFFLDVAGETQDQLYQYRARVDVLVADGSERVRIATLDDEGRWSDPRTYNLPFEQILDHPRSP